MTILEPEEEPEDMENEEKKLKDARGRVITLTERERISGEVDVEDKKKYKAVSRVRRRIQQELPEEIELLEENHPELLEELREVVCETSVDSCE